MAASVTMTTEPKHFTVVVIAVGAAAWAAGGSRNGAVGTCQPITVSDTPIWDSLPRSSCSLAPR
jgi:hypothetical protein